MKRYYRDTDGMYESPDGGYVIHDDAAAALAARDQRIAELEQRIAAQAELLERAEAALVDLRYFLEQHSNRWDGATGKHPAVLSVECSATLAAIRAALEGQR